MLKLLCEKDLSAILGFCQNSILGARIACYALSYGFDKDFLMFWGEESKIGFNCIVSKFDGNVTVLANDCADFCEIAEFLSIVGANSITTDEETALKLGYENFAVKTGFCYKPCDFYCKEVQNASEADIKEIYTLISQSIPDSFENTKEAYLSFLSDFTYRQKRGYATARCIRADKKVVACALTAAQSNTDALLSGIACEENYRKFGYGKKIVLSTAAELSKKGKNIFVIALNSSAEGFYKHIGFDECEKIAII